MGGLSVQWLPHVAVVLAAAGSAWAFSRWRSLSDDGSLERERKEQARPVPLALGPALAVGVLVACAWDHEWATPFGVVAASGLLPGLAAAFAVGLLDDLLPRGLSPLVKFLGQCAAAALLAWGSGLPAGSASLLGALALAGANLSNTFDNADGACLLAPGGACLLSAHPAGAAVAALLPFNLARGGARAYLGDSGSHLLGFLACCLHPWAWLGLALPAIDLCVVSGARLAAGAPPWRGDRRHLAHRLQRAGLGRAAVAAWLGAAGLLPWCAALGAEWTGLQPAAGAVAGACASLALHALLWRRGLPQARHHA
jgi:UDP-GlcNAc:undecaprenyl-phosphate GlcNAc-1-phosphate transferase